MKFNANEIDNYVQETTGYFSLKDDGDSARVRVLYEGVSDVEGFCVHQIQMRDRSFRYVDCIRDYNDPIDACPLCACKNDDNKKLRTKIWIPLYNVDTNETVMWERGNQFWKKVLYPLMVEKGEPFCGHIFEIVRHGAAGDTNTTYEFVDLGVDDTTLDDFDEIPNPLGTMILNKNFEELTTFVKTGSFDADEDDIPDVPVRRRGASADNAPDVTRRRGTTRPNTDI